MTSLCTNGTHGGISPHCTSIPSLWLAHSESSINDRRERVIAWTLSFCVTFMYISLSQAQSRKWGNNCMAWEELLHGRCDVTCGMNPEVLSHHSGILQKLYVLTVYHTMAGDLATLSAGDHTECREWGTNAPIIFPCDKLMHGWVICIEQNCSYICSNLLNGASVYSVNLIFPLFACTE